MGPLGEGVGVLGDGCGVHAGGRGLEEEKEEDGGGYGDGGVGDFVQKDLYVSIHGFS